MTKRPCSFSGYTALPAALHYFYPPASYGRPIRIVPGLADFSIDLEELLTQLRTSDGPPGCLGFYVSPPRDYDASRLWLGIIRSSSSGGSQPEFCPFRPVWRSFGALNNGTLDPNFAKQLMKRSVDLEAEENINWTCQVQFEEDLDKKTDSSIIRRDVFIQHSSYIGRDCGCPTSN
ncbi:hypothetical protein CVT26_007947 [Gymnopilus dilepis]|uniref:Uncharacterized protein n=1 Tax=Gymnopilus dilepis TaxID=231916 RepID=A0A409WEQ9_9AGAR|nr:hypothetical protein CVT26_007947 [Gymnopilus dilepis]